MKKSLSFIVGALVALGATATNAETNWGARAGSSANLSSAPATRTRQNVNYEKYQTRTLTKTYESKDAGDLYYAKPANRSALYKQYEGSNSAAARATKTTTRTTRSENVVGKLKRKYYLAHPFFQPLGGMFGSITDMSYGMNSYDFTINQTVPVLDGGSEVYPLNGLGGAWKSNGFSIKEDFSYGITDRIAVLAMAQYDTFDYKFEWDDNSPDDKMDDSGLNLFGLGAQWRFIDNDKWIATLSGYYQHQKDISDNFVLDLKAGYKVASSTIYGVARGWYLSIDGDSYGNGVAGTDASGVQAFMYIPYQVGDDSAFYIEGGLGVFSVLNEDWTLNVEAIIGHYDWHNQGSIKGAIGWQPNDWFGLELYAKTVFMDSADGKELGLWWMEPNVGLDNLTKIGTVELDNYSETSVGLRAIFQF